MLNCFKDIWNAWLSNTLTQANNKKFASEIH